VLGVVIGAPSILVRLLETTYRAHSPVCPPSIVAFTEWSQLCGLIYGCWGESARQAGSHLGRTLRSGFGSKIRLPTPAAVD
jgi:hypothetical protein